MLFEEIIAFVFLFSDNLMDNEKEEKVTQKITKKLLKVTKNQF